MVTQLNSRTRNPKQEEGGYFDFDRIIIVQQGYKNHFIAQQRGEEMVVIQSLEDFYQNPIKVHDEVKIKSRVGSHITVQKVAKRIQLFGEKAFDPYNPLGIHHPRTKVQLK